MSTQQIERVEGIAVIVAWLLRMRVAEVIDAVWQPHGHWQGLSYGQLAVLLLTFILYTHTHKLSHVEDWGREHQHTLELSAGWQLGAKDLTDDRLGRLLEVLGADEEQSVAYQQPQSQHLIRAYALPTAVVRYDTISFKVHHAPTAATAAAGLRAFGYRKDRRPDLLQFKQGLGTLDPAGVPLLTQTLAGHQADDSLYIPAWQEAWATVGHTDCLFVADCKASALETRGTLAAEGGYYLFPQTLTGEVPELLARWVAEPPKPQLSLVFAPRRNGGAAGARLRGRAPHDGDHGNGGGAHLDGTLAGDAELRAGPAPDPARLHARLAKAEERLRAKPRETPAEFLARAPRVLQQQPVTGLFQLTVTETVTTRRRYLQRQIQRVEGQHLGIHSPPHVAVLVRLGVEDLGDEAHDQVALHIQNARAAHPVRQVRGVQLNRVGLQHKAHRALNAPHHRAVSVPRLVLIQMLVAIGTELVARRGACVA